MSTSTDRDPPVPGPARTEPVLVRGDSDAGLVGLLLLLAAGLLLVGFHDQYYQARSRSPFYCWIASAVCAGATVAVLSCLLYRRRWIEPTPEGFALIERGRRVLIGDDCVRGLTIWYPWTPSDSARHRVRLELQVDGRLRRLECGYSVDRTELDPLTPLWDRLIAGLARRARAGLDAGAAMAGRGWRLDGAGLHIEGQVVPVRQVTKVMYLGRRLCVWKGDDERPFARIPAFSRNVQPLGVLLWEAAGGAEGNRPLPGSPLGRVLVDRRAYDGVLGVAILQGLILGCGVYFPSQFPSTWTDVVSIASGTAALLLVGFALSVIHTELMPRLVFHEKGVRWPTARGTETLLLDDVAKVVWIANGAGVVLQFGREEGKPPFNLHAVLMRSAKDLAYARDAVCRRLARAWASEVPSGPVRWTKRLRFLPGGLEYTPFTLLGQPHPVTVPYHVTSYQIEHGVFKLFVVGEVGPVLKETTARENFFVGLALLHLIYDDPDAVSPRSAG